MSRSHSRGAERDTNLSDHQCKGEWWLNLSSVNICNDWLIRDQQAMDNRAGEGQSGKDPKRRQTKSEKLQELRIALL